MKSDAIPTIVLVNGAWTNVSTWGSVIRLLHASGHHVVAVHLALASLDADIAITRRILGAQRGPTVLVGHSYGGAVLTGLGADTPSVTSLVYVAAFVPAEGESAFSSVADFPRAPGNQYLVPDDRPGFLRVDPIAYPQVFMQDVDPTEAAALAVTQRAVAEAALIAPVGRESWRTLPSWYLVSEDDRMINPDAERAMAARIKAHTTTIRGASHASLISHPEEVTRVILSAAIGTRRR